jgi:hypothetical protein
MKLIPFQNARAVTHLFLCLATGPLSTVLAQPVSNEPADVAALRAEVHRLGLELLQLRAELTQWKIETVSAHLQQARAERQRLTSERQIMEREIGDLSQGSANTAGSSGDERREELKNVQLPGLLTSERAAMEREASLGTVLGGETARRNEIHKELERRAARAPRSR